MNKNLSLLETRVIGVLLEKEITTPDQYPMSLNALVNACNQKSNREPVLELKESAVQETVDGLIKKFLVNRASGHGGRVTKYQHRFCNTEFGTLKLPPKALAIVCELLLRGPQTPGELRSHAERLCKFADVGEVESELDKLAAREEPLVVKLPREPGKRESRYAHLFGDMPPPVRSHHEATLEASPESGPDRCEALEQQLRALRQEVEELKLRLEILELG